jgi:dihydrolipoyl dehydrogenase
MPSEEPGARPLTAQDDSDHSLRPLRRTRVSTRGTAASGPQTKEMPPHVNDSDLNLVIIGAGPGGYAAAVRAAELGMKVACVEQQELGGTCLNVGCIPSKALLESSELYARLTKGVDHHGIDLGAVSLDLGAMMRRKQKIVKAMTGGISALFQRAGVQHVTGQARLAAPGSVVVSTPDGEAELCCEHVLIATGSVPAELPLLPFDGQRIISSTEALALDAVPGRLAVIGAGAIGLELGSVWSRLGADVTVIEYTDQILPGMDTEMAGQLQRLLKRQHLTTHLGARALGAEVAKDVVRLHLQAGEKEWELDCDRVLVAVGRRACTAGLGLQELGLELDAGGRVPVDSDYRTAIDGVYAIGDVLAGPMLAHKAEAEGVAAVERMAGKSARVNYAAMPGVVYTHPELACVGLTETAAREEHGEVRIGKHSFRANARAHCMDEIDGLVKVISHGETDHLLGIHILGPQASQLIAEAVLALEFGVRADDLARTIHAHPALSEVVRDAARATWQ